MNKKVIAIVLSIALAVGSAGCGNSGAVKGSASNRTCTWSASPFISGRSAPQG